LFRQNFQVLHQYKTNINSSFSHNDQ
jgi:hypothetical protein